MHPQVGAGVAALGCDALAAILEACRLGRLTRNQHVLLRLGELIAYAEGAASLADRAAAAADGDSAPQGRHPLRRRRPGRDQPGVRPRGRLEGRRGRAALGAGRRHRRRRRRARLVLSALDEIRAAQAGLLADMDQVAGAVYGRFA